MTTWDDLDDDGDLIADALARPRRSRQEGPPLETGQGAAAPARAVVTTHDEPALAAPAGPDTIDHGPVAPQPQDGFADPSGTVRVWADDAGTVMRVHVSTRWRESGAMPLSSRLLFAAQQATMSLLFPTPGLPGSGLPEAPHYPGVPLSEEPFDERLLADLREESLQVQDELAKLAGRSDVRPTVIHHDAAVGSSGNRKVRVTLDHRRRPEAVWLDEAWASSARAERIIESVTEAFEDAYALWREPVIEPGEHDELIARLNDLERQILEPVLVVCGYIDPRRNES